MKIALLGDVALFGRFSLNENPGIISYFEELSEYLNEFDLVVCNLESPFISEGKKFGSKSAYISSSPVNVRLLKYLNIGLVNLSNNHIYDFGRKGYEETISALEKNKVSYFGTDKKVYRHFSGNNRLVFSGHCCFSTNPCGIRREKSEVGVEALCGESIENNLRTHTEDGFLSILSMHCGDEHVNYPRLDHIYLSRKLADISPYVYYGHHPHVIQGIEKYGESIIAHSLGNFCFDDVYSLDNDVDPIVRQSSNNNESIILCLDISNNKIVNYCTTTIKHNSDKLTIRINEENEKLNKYSKYLTKKESVYLEKRRVKVQYIAKQWKDKRDLSWYLSRLNMNTVRRVLDMLVNMMMYKKCINKYINKAS